MKQQENTSQKAFVPPTAGVIIIKQQTHVLLVETKSVSNWGFPKGSREKGETSIENAMREMNEECGLNQSDIQLIRSVDDTDGGDAFVYFDEMTNRNTLSCRYFLATLNNEDKELRAMNTQEVFQLGYYTIDKAIQLLKPSRQSVLRQAIDYLNTNHQS